LFIAPDEEGGSFEKGKSAGQKRNKIGAVLRASWKGKKREKGLALLGKNVANKCPGGSSLLNKKGGQSRLQTKKMGQKTAGKAPIK